MKKISLLINQIYDIEIGVRNHINTHRFQKDLISNINLWSQICSSLDVIGDTLLSIEGYFEENFPSIEGLKYIYIYGLLQSLFIQQDAMRNLSEAFSIEYEISGKLKSIREIRNSAIGHPTKNNMNKKFYYNHISRPSLSKESFTLLKYSEDNTDIINVNIYEILFEQLDEICNKYKKILEILREEEKNHINKYKDNKLENIFDSSMFYKFEKINSAITSNNSGDKEFGLSMLTSVNGIYIKFKKALEKRNELTDELLFELNEYFYAIEKLSVYIQEGKQYDAYINLYYIREKTKYFMNYAKEIDVEYSEK